MEIANEQMISIIRNFLAKRSNERFIKECTHIYTRELCQFCGGKFIDSGEFMLCEKCLSEGKISVPGHYYLEFTVNSKTGGHRVKIFSTSKGQGITSYEIAKETMEEIAQKLGNGTFNRMDYKLDTCTQSFQFNVLIQEWVDFYEQRYDQNLIAPNTFLSVKRLTKQYFLPYFRGMDVRRIGTSEIDKWFFALPRNLSSVSKVHIKKYLCAFFKYLLKMEKIDKLPFFPKLQAENKDVKIIDQKTLDKIFLYLPEKHKPIYTMLRYQALRPSEARALRWENVDFEKKIICIAATFSGNLFRKKTKTGKNRVLPLHPKVLETLLQIRPKDAHPETFVFQFRKGKKDPSKEYAERTIGLFWACALKKAGVPHYKLYTLRHTAASFGVKNAGIVATRDFLGHSNISMTNRYVHSSGTDDLKEFFGPVKPIG